MNVSEFQLFLVTKVVTSIEKVVNNIKNIVNTIYEKVVKGRGAK